LQHLPDGAPGTAETLLFVGGLHRMHGGAFAGVELSAQRRDAVYGALFRQGQQVARQLDRRAVALFVPQEQADVADAVLDRPPRRLPAPPRAHIVGLDRFADLDGYTAAQTKAVRHTLRRDQRRLAGRTVEVEAPARLSTLLDASGLIVGVKANNGIRDSPRLTRMRLTAEYGQPFAAQAGPESYVAWCLRSPGGDLTGYSLAALEQRHLTMIEIGLSDTSPTRGDDYVLLELLGPVQYGLQHGVGSIDLGGGHLDPKLSRGAVLIPSYHLIL